MECLPVRNFLVVLVTLLASACSRTTPIDGSLSADLSICQNPNTFVRSDAPVSMAEFARILHGTWKLSTRSIQGVAIDARADFYFDLKNIEEDSVSGTALCLDRGNLSALDPMELCPECLANASVGAHWTVNATRKSESVVSLVMSGEFLGSYGDFRKGITGTEQTEFVKRSGVYLAGRLTSPAGGHGFSDDTWDLVSLTPEILTYVSCKNGYIDQYTKTASIDPFVEGISLTQAWEKRRRDGSLLNPRPVWEEQDR
jgi:hypothetical protein